MADSAHHELTPKHHAYLTKNPTSAQATAALADNQKLLMLVSAMQPHKQSMHLHALDSQRSSVGSCTPGLDHKGTVYEARTGDSFPILRHLRVIRNKVPVT